MEYRVNTHRLGYVRYAEDFLVFGRSVTLLQQHVKPAIQRFLQPVSGLRRSGSKTKVHTIIAQDVDEIALLIGRRGTEADDTDSRSAVRCSPLSATCVLSRDYAKA